MLNGFTMVEDSLAFELYIQAGSLDGIRGDQCLEGIVECSYGTTTLVLEGVLLILSDLLQDCAFHLGARQLFPLLSHFYTIYMSFCKFCSIKRLKKKGKSRKLKSFKYWTARQYITCPRKAFCFRQGLH